MRAIDAALHVLSRSGVRYLFGIPAGSVNALYDSLLDHPEITPIVVKHEAQAAFMAANYARLTGIPGICAGCSGPGATQLTTGVALAQRDQLPLLVFTGGVPSARRGLGGAQELDAEPLYRPITKWSTTVLDPHDLLAILQEAWRVALTPPRGPVHIALPIDVQKGDIGDPRLPALPATVPAPPAAARDLERMAAMLAGARRGAILAGAGAKSARRYVLELAERLYWPIATTPHGKSCVPETHPLSVGVYGLAGNERAQECLNDPELDVLVVLGSSLGETGTCGWSPKLFPPGRAVIHVDHNPAVFGRVCRPALAVQGDVTDVLRRLLPRLGVLPALAANALDQARTQAAAAVQPGPHSVGETTPAWKSYLNTHSLIARLQELCPAETLFCIDVGEFMTYAIKYMRMQQPLTFQGDVNYGSMGSAIGGAIGAQLAQPGRPVVCLTGDGCFYMYGYEILTAKRHRLPVVFVVVNNARLGMVYHGHKLQYGRVLDDFSHPRDNLAAICQSLGVANYRVETLEDLNHVAPDALFHRDGPTVIEVVVDGNEVPPMGERVKFLAQT